MTARPEGNGFLTLPLRGARLALGFTALLAVTGWLHAAARSHDAPAGPDYASERSREVVELMVEAHGGLDIWSNAGAISYDNYFFNPSWDQYGWTRPFWISKETIEQGGRRAHQYWPLLDARVGYDGTDVWSVDYVTGNPAKFQIYFFYYFVNLPWITQDENVTVGEPGSGRLPGIDRELLTIELGFSEKPGVGKNERDRYRLYVDPDTHLLRGYEYWVGWGPMLDAMNVPAGELFGPMVRVHDNFAEVEGLLIPSEMSTFPPGGDEPIGHHLITNYRLEKSFDWRRAQAPQGAVIDRSEDRRAGS